MKTVKVLIETAAAQLKEAGITGARWDAELLVAHGLNKSRLDLYAYPEVSVDQESQEAVSRLVVRRQSRYPLQYLIGFHEFWGLSFKVTPHVLIPRTETELLVETAVNLYETGRKSPRVVADIGTGSGCLAVALAKEMPGSWVYATDVSEEALSIAEENAKIHGVEYRVRFLRGDLCEPIKRMGFSGRVDLLVSNLPYIPRAAFAQLQSEVRDYEPRIALDGGADGLDVYRRLLAQAGEVLAKQGMMILELGDRQAEGIKTIVKQYRLVVQQVVEDGFGIPRVIVLNRP